jgi:DNA-binding MarR family transcriptional regulator
MSRGQDPLDRKPLIGLADKAAQVLGADMIRESHARGHRLRLAHNAVLGHLPLEGGRTSDIAARAGITKQSMGEVVRELVEMGLLEMTPDPSDRRAKLVTYTERGRAVALDGRRYLAELERRFANEFGEQKYAHAREVLEKVIESFAPE